MYVHVEVLEGRGCYKIEVRVGSPGSRKGTYGMAFEMISAQIVGTAVGLTVSEKLSAKIKHQITRRVFNRDLDNYQLRLYTLKHRGGKDAKEHTWLGVAAIRLPCPTDGYVVERWVPMQPATKTEPGALRVRIVVRESEADANAVLADIDNSSPTHTTPCEGCCCDVCDPHFQLAKPAIDTFDFDREALDLKQGQVARSPPQCALSACCLL